MENLTLTNSSLGIASPVAAKPVAPADVKVAEVTPRKETKDPELDLKQREEGQQTLDSVQRRLDLLKRLANLYAVSDTRFTIYKQNGEYYTRITNLRDGKVTVIPEPDLLTQLGVGSLLETSV